MPGLEVWLRIGNTFIGTLDAGLRWKGLKEIIIELAFFAFFVSAVDTTGNIAKAYAFYHFSKQNDASVSCLDFIKDLILNISGNLLFFCVLILPGLLNRFANDAG